MAASEQLHRIAVYLTAAPADVLEAAGRRVVAIAGEEADRVGNPLHGKRRRPITLTATAAVDRLGGGYVCRVKGTPVGPWVWMDTGTAAHRIRRRRRGPMARMTVPHPGTSGRRAWRNVRRRTAEEIRDLVAGEIVDGLP